MIVMKFGGTSVESAAAIERVAAIVKARASRRPVGTEQKQASDIMVLSVREAIQ